MLALTLAYPLIAAVLLSQPGQGEAAASPGPSANPPALEPSPISRLEGAWRLSVGTGAGSAGVIDFADGLDCSGCASDQRLRDPWQVNLRLEREVGQRFRLGLAWAHARWTTRSFDNATLVGTSENSAETLLAGVNLCWARTRWLEIYSGLAAGVTRHRTFDATGVAADDEGITFVPAVQLRSIGVTAGGDRIRAFAEVGLGSEGVLLGGLMARL